MGYTGFDALRNTQTKEDTNAKINEMKNNDIESFLQGVSFHKVTSTKQVALHTKFQHLWKLRGVMETVQRRTRQQFQHSPPEWFTSMWNCSNTSPDGKFSYTGHCQQYMLTIRPSPPSDLPDMTSNEAWWNALPVPLRGDITRLAGKNVVVVTLSHFVETGVHVPMVTQFVSSLRATGCKDAVLIFAHESDITLLQRELVTGEIDGSNSNNNNNNNDSGDIATKLRDLNVLLITLAPPELVAASGDSNAARVSKPIIETMRMLMHVHSKVRFDRVLNLQTLAVKFQHNPFNAIADRGGLALFVTDASDLITAVPLDQQIGTFYLRHQFGQCSSDFTTMFETSEGHQDTLPFWGPAIINPQITLSTHDALMQYLQTMEYGLSTQNAHCFPAQLLARFVWHKQLANPFPLVVYDFVDGPVGVLTTQYSESSVSPSSKLKNDKGQEYALVMLSGRGYHTRSAHAVQSERELRVKDA